MAILMYLLVLVLDLVAQYIHTSRFTGMCVRPFGLPAPGRGSLAQSTQFPSAYGVPRDTCSLVHILLRYNPGLGSAQAWLDIHKFEAQRGLKL